MRLLLIGHGYLGSEVARRFRSAGWDVVPVSLHGGEGSLACDVSSLDAVLGLPEVDVVVHCAASGRGGEEAYQQVYVDGCRNLLRRYPGKLVLFTSSTSVYAQTDGSVVTEESPALPDRETGKLLLEAEDLVLHSGGIVARLAGIYGPGRSVILRKFLSGEAVLEDDGSRYLNQIHRDDAAAAIVHLVSGRICGVFNVSDSTPMSQRVCYEALGQAFDRPLPPSGLRDLGRKRGWTHKKVSNAKLRASGWEPRYPSFLDAVRDVARTL